jgi:hypothetical protein
MNKEFIPHKEALALKELGFDEPCFGYTENGDEGHVKLCGLKLITNTFCKKIESISIPLYQQAFRWFREKYGMKFYIRQDKWNKWCEVYIMTNDDMDPEYIELDDAWIYEEAGLACLRKLIEIVKDEDKKR